MANKTKIRLLTTVLVVFGALVFVSAGSIFLLQLISTRTIVAHLASRVVARSLDGMELALRNHLDAAVYQADFIADSIESGAISFDEREKLAEFVTGSLAAAPQIRGLVVGSTDGNAIRIARLKSGEIRKMWFALEDDEQLEGMAGEISLRRDAFWGQPLYRENLRETLLTFNMPIWRNGKYVGFVSIGVSTDELSELALKLSEPPRSTVFVLDSEDNVVAHMFLALQTPRLSADKPLPAINEVLDPVLNQLRNGIRFKLDGFKPPDNTEVLDLEIEGIRHLVFKKPLANYGQRPLVLAAYSQASASFAWIHTMQRVMLIGIALIILSLGVSVAASRMIAGPVRETSKGAAAIASLDFEKVTPLRESRIREIDDLANSFNAMLVGLRSFDRYVPRNLVRRLIRENRVGAGIEERELTVMFTDIAGFTATCEGMTPPEVVDFINHHLSLVVACIEREGGTIDKYIGDAVMAFWGAPDSIDDAPIRACRAAVAIQNAIANDNKARLAKGQKPVRIRIGIHTGPLIVGDIGAPGRINYTVVGDVVNTAQRLEGLGKEVNPYAESIALISHATRDKLDDSFKLKKAGNFQVEGKRKQLSVYRIDSENGLSA